MTAKPMEARMLRSCVESHFTDQDEFIFQAVVPEDHRLRTVAANIDFEAFRDLLAPYYHQSMGRPGDPVLLVKVVYLQFHYCLSDAQIIERLRTDMALRWFAGLSLMDAPPNSSTLCYFRSRLGVEGTQKVMDSLIGQAKQRNLLKYRLRLKDATHVEANIAILATLPLVAEVREKILDASGPFAEQEVAAAEARMVEIRAATKDSDDVVRLATRVELLREILAWAVLLERPEDAEETLWRKFEQSRDLLQKMFEDAQDPKAGDRLRSAQDPDARRGKHGKFYDGYLVDVLMDADSELITSVNVLPANGYEGLDAVELMAHEISITGRQVQAISIDGAGSPGEVVRQLSDPDGLALDVYVPPQDSSAPADLFPSSVFEEDDERKTVTCPAGHQSHSQSRDESRNGMTYVFQAATCAACPLLNRCMAKPPKKAGRKVRKSDYEKEYQATREKAKTPEYKAIKKEHPKVERKLSELINRHGARRARYWGLPKVLCQQLWTAFAVNVKRIIKLTSQAHTAGLCTPAD